MSCTSASIRADPLEPSTAIGSHRVVDVVVDVRHTVHHPHDPALERLRQRRAAGVADDPVAHLLGQIQSRPVALEMLDHPQ
jgi:hypothetical protein